MKRIPEVVLPASEVPLDGAIDPAAYRLGAGDELALEVVGRLAMSVHAVVDPEGDLWIPDFGHVKVGGLTLAGARAAVRKMFHGTTHGVEADLRLVKLRHIKLYVSGQVLRPGVVEATAATRASEVVERAGGLLDNASHRNVVLRGADGKDRSVDLVRFERLGDRAANPYVNDGDQLFVPPVTERIYLYAPALYPGAFEYRAGDRVADLLAMGGGLTAQAEPTQARLVHFRTASEPETLAVDLPAVLAGAPGPTLSPGDRLFVPAQAEYHPDRHFTVTGEVIRTGTYPLHEGVDRLSDAITAAGGFTAEAARRSVLLVRQGATPFDQDTEFQRLSRLSRAEMTSSEYGTFRTKLAAAQSTFLVDATGYSGGPGAPGIDPTRDVLLQAGDVVRVDRTDYSVLVSGRVKHPGLVAFSPGLDGESYISRAGGLAAQADHKGTRVTRAITGQTLSLRDVPSIDPGDLIYVPDSPDHNRLAGLRDVLLVVGSVATVVIAFRK